MINLNEKYSQNDFLNFLNEFLPDFEKDIRPVGSAGLQVVNKASYLGKSPKLDLAVFELPHTGSQAKRVALATDGFRILKQSATFQALVVFYSTDTEEWRISLMTATPERNERGGVVVRLSNPKRYSFALGETAKTNTPYNFLIKKGKVADFDDLKSRFSVEVVNKEFYKEIANLYTKLVGGIRGEGRNRQEFPGIIKLPSVPKESHLNQEFAVRMIGRIIFCWFLREKRSDTGLPLIPSSALSLGAAKENPDYYHSVLEPLFFEVLNKVQNSRKDRYQKEPYKQIPYLNGGLFSPQHDDYYTSDDGKQTINHNTLVIPDEWLQELFEILEKYNFTVDENTTVDIDLSIDPEMLGRIFENLLAEINPETGESARKSTGSYYTPRTIVEYMVDESLYQYLKGKTDIEESKLRALISYDLIDDEDLPLTPSEKQRVIDSLGAVTILDPACGSGAFPIGALQKIVFMLQRLDPEGQLWFNNQLAGATPEIRRVIEREFSHKNFDYIRKLGVIRESIFGVDIQPIASEIARLRCFLTLVVEERVADEEPNRGIEPLPNLDFKFVTANSLIGLPSSQNNGQVELFEDQEGIDQLKSVRDEYFNASGAERENLKLRFVQIQNKMFQKMIEHQYHADLTRKLSAWDPFGHEAADWFDTDWMFGVKEGFDIVIANPPYGIVFDEVLKPVYLRLYQSFKRNNDVYVAFYERGEGFLRNHGILTYISPNTFMNGDYFKGFRKFLTQKTKINEILDFKNSKVFEDPTVFVCILSTLKIADIKYPYSFKLKIVRDTLINFDLYTVVVNTPSESQFKEANKLLNRVLKEDDVALMDSLFYVRDVGFNYWTIGRGKTRGQNSIGDRIFYRGEKENPDDKPFLKGVDVSKYHLSTPTNYLRNNYESYLDPNKDIFGFSKEFLEINPKIVYRQTSSKLVAALDLNANYLDKTVHLITPKETSRPNLNLKYILALLNSKLFQYFYNYLSQEDEGRTFSQVKTTYIKQLPVKKLSLQAQKPILDLVDKVLDITREKNYSSSSQQLEKVSIYAGEIDQWVYKLYGLTSEEIKVVEGGAND